MSNTINVAPMIQWTDRHWRYLFRTISKNTTLYTEMTMDNAILYNSNKLDPFIGYSKIEEPLVLQLGGNDPVKLSDAALVASNYGQYEAINLNCGCPSNKAKKAGFGAELMLDPLLVEQILTMMKRKVTSTDISIKCRLGVTGRESWEDIVSFIHMISRSGIRHIILHARSCVLKGLSTAQNRTIPPLKYDWVHRLATLFPEIRFTLNGGITSFGAAISHLGANYRYSELYSRYQNHLSSSSIYTSLYGIHHHYHHPQPLVTTHFSHTSDTTHTEYTGDGDVDGVSGVMIGREAYNNIFLFTYADYLFYQKPLPVSLTRREILEQYLEYATDAQEKGVYGSGICNILKPLHNFFAYCECNKTYKHILDAALKSYTTNTTTTNNNNNNNANNKKKKTTTVSLGDEVDSTNVHVSSSLQEQQQQMKKKSRIDKSDQTSSTIISSLTSTKITTDIIQSNDTFIDDTCGGECDDVVTAPINVSSSTINTCNISATTSMNKSTSTYLEMKSVTSYDHVITTSMGILSLEDMFWNVLEQSVPSTLLDQNIYECQLGLN